MAGGILNMANWMDVGQDHRCTASLLFQNRKWRGFASRAYYGAFSYLTQALLDHGAHSSFNNHYGHPYHRDLPQLVTKKLTRFSDSDRRMLKKSIRRLYAYRLDADYRPGITFEEQYARGIMGEWTRLLAILEKHYGKFG